MTGTNWATIVNARTRGQAKAQYHQRVSDAWPNIPYTDIRCRKLGPPHTSTAFAANAAYRGMSGVCCGQWVRVGGGRGAIVGHNECANFNVLFDDDSPRFAGLVLSCHPDEVTLEDLS